MDCDGPKEEFIASDQKRLVVDAFARYRIVDPLKFFQTVGTEAIVRTRLAAIINASIRQALGSVPLEHIISVARAALLSQIRMIVHCESTHLRIDVLHLLHTLPALPDATSAPAPLPTQPPRRPRRQGSGGRSRR